MGLKPHVEGTATIHSPGPAFFAAFARRIETGLLAHAAERRNRYLMTRQEADGLAFRAVNGWSAFNVGLNEVDLSSPSAGVVKYRIGYPRWAGYVVGMGAVIGGLLIATFFLIDIRAYIASHQFSRIPGLSLDQNLAVAWGLALFFGFVWSWILVVLHKGPLRGLMHMLITEVDAAAKA